MNTNEIALSYKIQAGWSEAELLQIVLDYIENQGSHDAFEDYLRERRDSGIYQLPYEGGFYNLP